MDPLETLKAELTKVGEDLRTLKGLGEELTDEQLEQYKELSAKAMKLKIRIEGIEAEAAAAKVASEQQEAETQKRIDDAVAEATRKMEAKFRRPDFIEGVPLVAKYGDTWKYDQLDAVELSLMIDMQHNIHQLNPNTPAPRSGAFKALSLRIAELDEHDSRGVPEGMEEEHRKNILYAKGSFKAATNIEPTKDAVEAAIKAATDPMYTGASPMSDWVGTAYSQSIWEKIRGGLVVAQNIPSDTIPDGYSSKVWPLESTDFTWYKVAETTSSNATTGIPNASVTASQLGTANKTISVGKLGARGMYTGEADEDSLIAFAPQARMQLTKSGMEYLEHVIVDGDTETSANKNINDIAGTPAGTEPYLLVDGFRKLALVTNTANSRSASGGLLITDFKDTLKLMGTAGLNGADPTATAFLCDYNTMWAIMDIDEIKTKETFTAGTIEDGFLTRIYRTPVLYSFQMHKYSTASTYELKVNTAGKVDQDTTTNNTTGAILAVRWDQWKQAFKRRMTMEVTRIANADSWEIVALMRWGLAYRDTEASAITYNVGV